MRTESKALLLGLLFVGLAGCAAPSANRHRLDAMAAAKSGSFAEAIEEIDRCIALAHPADKSRWSYWHLRARWTLELHKKSRDRGLVERALADLSRSIELHGKHPTFTDVGLLELRFERAVLYYEVLDEPAKAEAELHLAAAELLRGEPDLVGRVHHHLRQVYLRLEKRAAGTHDAARLQALAARSARKVAEGEEYTRRQRLNRISLQREPERSRGPAAERAEARRKISCKTCSGLGHHIRLGYSETRVSTTDTRSGYILERQTTSVPTTVQDCLDCAGTGYVDEPDPSSSRPR